MNNLFDSALDALEGDMSQGIYPLVADGFSQRIYCANGDLFATVAPCDDAKEQARRARQIVDALPIRDAAARVIAAFEAHGASRDPISVMTLRECEASMLALSATLKEAQP